LFRNFKKWRKILRYVRKDLSSKELYLQSIKNNYDSIKFIDKKDQDKEICKKIKNSIINFI
jgi:hypothetical protein